MRAGVGQPMHHPSPLRAYLWPTLLLESYHNRRYRVMGATGSGKSSVSIMCLMIMSITSSVLLVHQSREWFELTGRNGPGVVYGRGQTCGCIHSGRNTGDPHRYPGIRRHHNERRRYPEDDCSFLNHHASIHRVRQFSISLTGLLDRYEKGFKLSGAIYIHRISDKRFTGTAARNFNMFRELCGDEALENVVLVTNMWGEVSPEEGQDRENQLTSKFFKPVLDKRAQMIRHLNTAQSAHNIIRGIVKNRPVVLQIQRELVDEHKDISATAAGNAVSRELNEQMRRHQDELKGVEEEIEQVLKEKDEEARQELEEDRRRLQEQVEKIKKDKEGMAFKYVAEKERMEAKLKEMEQEAKKEMERAEAEYRRPPTNLSYRPQDMANASVADRPGLKREIAGPSSQGRLDNFDNNRSVTIPSVPTNSGSNNVDRTNNRGKGPQPPSDSYTSLVRAQESCLQHLPAQKGASGIQFLVTVIDRAYERQSEASKERLRQMFSSVDEEVLDLVLEECGGELERSTKRLSEIASGS